MDIHSQHPYLLGFYSNLILNSNILVFQPYLGEDSDIQKNREDSQAIQCLPLGLPRHNWENHLDWCYFFSEDTAGSTVKSNTSSIRPILIDKTRIIGKFYIFFFNVHYRY